MIHRGTLILVVALAALTVAAGAGTVAGQTAPDCSQISYAGDGSEQNPYEVGNVDQLQCINNQSLSANYVQTSDIGASNTSGWNGGSGFAPIGNSSAAFNGTLNGSGFAIKRLHINRSRSSGDGTGLFGTTGSVAVIENVGIEDANITGGFDVGALIGNNDGGTVNGSYATGDVNGSGDEVGGLVGRHFNGTVNGSYATVNVSGTGIDSGNIGGLVGRNFKGTVNGSYATGNVSGDASVGGLVGNNYFPESSVNNSYATGNVFSGSGSNIGGLVGSSNGAVIGSYATGIVNGTEPGGGNVGGLVGRSNGAVIGSHATGAVSSPGDDVGGLIGRNGGGPVNGSYATGDVDSSGARVGGLIGDNFGAVNVSYATGDVDGSEVVGGLVGDNLEPINGSYATGDVDGSSGVGGLIGINTNAEMNSSYATGNVSGSGEVGGLAGENSGPVSESYATGNINASGDRVGGLVGQNRGSVNSSYATGAVGGSNIVGGLMGLSVLPVNESYATGDVDGSGDRVGGLVGVNFGPVNSSYATGSVNGSSKVGGLIGESGGTADGTYATGSVDASSGVGGLIGQNGADATRFRDGPNGTLRDSYWDSKTTRQSEAIGKEGGDDSQGNSGGESIIKGGVSGLSTNDMTGSYASNNMTAFDFTNTWDVETGGNASYPFLRNNTQTPPPIPEEDEGSFTEPLPVPGFDQPPRNIPVSEDGFSDTLYEDLDGDDNPTDIGPTVSVFGELIRGSDLGLTKAQARKLNWNSGSPADEVTVADMVTLFGEQIRAD